MICRKKVGVTEHPTKIFAHQVNAKVISSIFLLSFRLGDARLKMTWHARDQWIACALEMRSSNGRERPVLHCAFLLRTIFVSSVRAHQCARVQNIRDFPQTKLDSEIKAPFLLNEHGDPTFYFINSMRTISAITEKKFCRNLWLLFWQMK